MTAGVTATRTVTVDRPLEAVSRYLCEFATSADWIPHVVSCTAVDETPVRVGSRYRTVAKVGPLTETIEQVVTEFDGSARLVLEGRSRYLQTRDELVCAATVDGGTDVTYTARVELLGRARVAGAALAPFVTVTADQGARQLRAALLQVVPEAAVTHRP